MFLFHVFAPLFEAIRQFLLTYFMLSSLLELKGRATRKLVWIDKVC